MKHESTATANAAAVTVAVAYVLCRLLITLFPQISMSVAQSWFHGLELSNVSTWNLSTSSFILGLITSAASAWVLGYLFAKTYNYFVTKK